MGRHEGSASAQHVRMPGEGGSRSPEPPSGGMKTLSQRARRTGKHKRGNRRVRADLWPVEPALELPFCDDDDPAPMSFDDEIDLVLRTQPTNGFLPGRQGYRALVRHLAKASHLRLRGRDGSLPPPTIPTCWNSCTTTSLHLYSELQGRNLEPVIRGPVPSG